MFAVFVNVFQYAFGFVVGHSPFFVFYGIIFRIVGGVDLVQGYIAVLSRPLPRQFGSARFFVSQKSVLHGAIYRGIDFSGRSEAHFALVGMNVYVYVRKGHSYFDYEYGETPCHHSFAVCVRNGGG